MANLSLLTAEPPSPVASPPQAAADGGGRVAATGHAASAAKDAQLAASMRDMRYVFALPESLSRVGLLCCAPRWQHAAVGGGLPNRVHLVTVSTVVTDFQQHARTVRARCDQHASLCSAWLVLSRPSRPFPVTMQRAGLQVSVALARHPFAVRATVAERASATPRRHRKRRQRSTSSTRPRSGRQTAPPRSPERNPARP